MRVFGAQFGAFSLASNRFLEIFLDKLKGMIGSSPVAPSQEEVDAAFRAARAQSGGEASGAARAAANQTSSYPTAGPSPSSAPVAAGGVTPAGVIRLDSVLLRDYSTDERKAMAASGVAMADGSYPIPDMAALHDAVQAYGRSPDEATKAHIVKRARALGHTDVLPANWEGSSKAAAEGDDDLAPAYVALRLDQGAGLPEWQVFHQVGDHGSHPKYGPIVFSKADGDAIIRNHQAGVLGRQVPLDFRHGTSLDGEAGGWVEEFCWGRRGQSEPSGDGPILYARLTYNDVGRQMLENEHYRHQSPEYDRNYQGKYGAVALALAATNNPFLRGLRTLQGREQAPVMLDDATGEEPTVAEDPTQLHMPPGMASQPAQGTTQSVPPSRTPSPAANGPAGGQLGAMPVFQPGAKCPNCGTLQAGGEHFCSNCGAKAPAAGQATGQGAGGAYVMEATVPDNSIQLDTTGLQVQLAESQRRQAALEAQMLDLQRERTDGSVRARVDTAIYQGVAPALANEIGTALLDLGRIRLAMPVGSETVRLSAAPDDQAVSLAAALDVVSNAVAGLLEKLPRMPLGRRTAPSLDAPPAGESVALQDKAYDEAIKAKAAEMNRERGVPSRNGAGS